MNLNFGKVARGALEIGKVAGRAAVEAGAATAGSILIGKLAEPKTSKPKKEKASK